MLGEKKTLMTSILWPAVTWLITNGPCRVAKPTLGLILDTGVASGDVECEPRQTVTGEPTDRVHTQLLTVTCFLLALVNVWNKSQLLLPVSETSRVNCSGVWKKRVNCCLQHLKQESINASSIWNKSNSLSTIKYLKCDWIIKHYQSLKRGQKCCHQCES